ncbi:MAG: hypothetical protein GY838_07595 [bacterium]|nr:hypothetical protein [bacterium]
MHLSPIPRLFVSLALLGAGIAFTTTGSVSKAHAQSRDHDPQDVAISIIDGTTGEPTDAERLTLSYLLLRQDPVLDIEPDGSSFVLRDVPLRERGKYVLAVWKDGVPYFFSRNGKRLTEEEQVLHVFEATTDRAGVRITGLNLVVRRQESVLSLEYMLQLDNAASPQTTLKGDPGAFYLRMPAEASEVKAEYHRGADPIDVPVIDRNGRWYLDMGVVPGNNRIRVTALMPWREGVEVPVGSDLSIDAWSVLATPEWLEIDNNDLEPDPNAASGIKRKVGRALAPGRDFRFILRGGEIATGDSEDLFATETPEPAATEPDDDGAGWLPVMGAAVLGIAVIVVLARRRK